MADFCKQCSVEIFGEDFMDLSNLGYPKKLKPGQGWAVLCEHCGFTMVDDAGICIGQCTYNHGILVPKGGPLESTEEPTPAA